ncbi:MAG: type II toxin-antitoxin system VapC family toxin [Rhodospirillaceae bacterium]|nr:type II toxin-antitoxin system VapC family toxin [Rhodospirillaceae bacterium]
MAFVADASVAAAWVLPDESAAVADVVLDRLDAETAKVPGIFWHELRNLLLSAERRGRIDGGYADASMARLRQLSIVCPGDTEDRKVMALARAHSLSAYDASYLALAMREGCALASLDRRMNEAATAEGVATFS